MIFWLELAGCASLCPEGQACVALISLFVRPNFTRSNEIRAND